MRIQYLGGFDGPGRNKKDKKNKETAGSVDKKRDIRRHGWRRYQELPLQATEGHAMIITDSAVQLHTEHFLVEKYTKEEHLTVWQAGEEMRSQELPGGSGQGLDLGAIIAQQKASQVHLSSAGLAQPRFVKKLAQESPAPDTPMVDFQIELLRLLIERLTGNKIDIVRPEDILGGGTSELPPEMAGDAANADSSHGYGLIYQYHESYHESEKLAFSAQGVAQTSDGLFIEFSTELHMSRDFFTETSLEVRAGDALKDPLILNFNGVGAELSETKFSFDIDNDGLADQISFVEEGSGFLALDKNQDGEIGDGSELFGPTTGQGFSELAEHDDDSNGWIDERDAIYQNLRIWTTDGSGGRTLFSLGQKGIGAIYLGQADSPFSLKNETNDLLGQVRSTSIFLFEEGNYGTIQQVDLVV